MGIEQKALIFILVFGSIILFLIVLAYLSSIKKMSSGRVILKIKGIKQNKSIIFSDRFNINTIRKWCRISADVKAEYTLRYNDLMVHNKEHLKYLRYKLSLSDSKGNILFSEEKSLLEYLRGPGLRGSMPTGVTCYGKERGLPFKRKVYRICKGEIVLLEFISPSAGIYAINLSIDTEAETKERYFTIKSFIHRFDLYIKEDVILFSNTKNIFQSIDFMNS